MAGAKERAEKKEQTNAEEAAFTTGAEYSPEQSKRQMVTAVRSLAFDLLRAIDEPSPPKALERSTLSKYVFIRPFRNKWRLTPKGERAIKYHGEKDAFYAKRKDDGKGATAGP